MTPQIIFLLACICIGTCGGFAIGFYLGVSMNWGNNKENKKCTKQ